MTTDQAIQLVFDLLPMLATMTVVALTIHMLLALAWERPQRRRDLEREEALWHQILRERAMRYVREIEFVERLGSGVAEKDAVAPSAEVKTLDAWNEESER